MTHTCFSAHTFTSLTDAPFDVSEYSKLKFGCGDAAQRMGYELAEKYFNSHTADLIANRVLVFPSPYNHVKNAASIMTDHFIDRLNDLLVNTCGRHVESSTIHRKVSYTSDYGFLSKAKRKGLIDGDSFYLNREFLEDKLLVFIDDVKITGTHEDKLIEVLGKNAIDNDAHFLYYATYNGNSPKIEAELNFAYMKNVDTYVDMCEQDNHQVIIRPIKYILGQSPEVARSVAERLPTQTLIKMYHGCLAEGYYKIPAYQANFAIIASETHSRNGK